MTVTKYSIYKAVGLVLICILYTFSLNLACNGGGDPTGALTGLKGEEQGLEQTPVNSPDVSRFDWGGYVLDISPWEGTASVTTWDRGLEAHFDVTSVVTKPACSNCVRLDNFSFDPSAGIIDLDAVLVNPTIYSGYDVRAVLLLDEWETGRRLTNEVGLTDFWSGDPYHPDPYILFATEVEDRLFAPMAEHSAHVNISLPTPAPYNFLVPFIVDASYPDHPQEPVEISNIQFDGSIHPTGYDFTISLDLLDYQGDASVYLDCSPLNPVVGLRAFVPGAGSAAGENYTSWTLHLKSDITNTSEWLPVSLGEFELPIVALDPISTSRTFQRTKVNVVVDEEPPQWTGEMGIDEVWWGSERAIVSYFPATDPSGPVLYNIYSSTDIPLIPPGKSVVTSWSHYAVGTVDGATYTFIVCAEDQAGNENSNDIQLSGMSQSMTQVWEQIFPADLESTPNVVDINCDNVPDVIFGCDNGYVYSLSGETGAIQWSFLTNGMVKSSAAIRDVNDDDTIDVVIGSNDSSIYAINTVFEQPYAMMTFETGSLVESSPVCADQTGDGIPEVVVGSFDNKLYAFEGGSGELLVGYDTGAPVKATPALEDFNGDTHLDVVVASGGVIRVINGITGESIWSHDFQTGFSLGSPAIGDLNQNGVGDVVVGSKDGVYAFDVSINELIWYNQELSGDFDTCPALGDITGDGIPDVAISSRYQRVFLLDGTDGSLIWSSKDSIYMPTSPTLADMNSDGVVDVVVGSADFYLRIINGADGLTLAKWSTTPFGVVTTIPLIADVNSDGNIDIVFGTESHRMFAITTNHPLPTDLDLLPWPKYMRTRSNTGNLAHPLF